jgi:hypothetical protein
MGNNGARKTTAMKQHDELREMLDSAQRTGAKWVVIWVDSLGMHLQGCRWKGFRAIRKESCRSVQHLGESCVYPVRAVEVKASRGEF